MVTRSAGRVFPLSAGRFGLPSLEPLIFAMVVLLHLVPVWAFRYLPTQDGPSHVANALMLKDYWQSGTRYHELFEPRWEAFPNWTSHALLVGLMCIVPLLVAEKMLVSVYIIGFAGSFRYFLSAFGSQTTPLAPVWLLFVFNRFFLMGFYHFCLSL